LYGKNFIPSLSGVNSGIYLIGFQISGGLQFPPIVGWFPKKGFNGTLHIRPYSELGNFQELVTPFFQFTMVLLGNGMFMGLTGNSQGF